MESSQYGDMFAKAVDRRDWFRVSLALEEQPSLVEEPKATYRLEDAYNIFLREGDLHGAGVLRAAVRDSKVELKEVYLEAFDVLDDIRGTSYGG